MPPLKPLGPRRLVPALTLLCALACGDDGGAPADETGSTSAATTPSSTSTASGTASGSASGSPTTDPADTGETTMDPTETTGSEVGMCQDRCEADDDCIPGFACEDERCVVGTPCPDDDWCTAQASGFLDEGCTGDGDCTVAGARCVELGVHTFCATEAVACAVDPMPLDVVEGGMLDVCVLLAGCTEGGFCFSQCLDDTTCADPFPTCNVDSGMCECSGDSCGPGFACEAGACVCADDSACALEAGAVCVEGRCGCNVDADCVGDNVDICVDGVCGCSGDAACQGMPIHPGATLECAPS